MKKEPGIYIRVLIVIIGICILSLLYTSFFLSDDKYEITSGTIILFLIIVVLALSESFNSLSIGKILSLSKEVQNKEAEKKEAKQESDMLRHELLKIVSNIQQSQVNNTFNTPPEYWGKALGVVPSDEKNSDSEENKQAEVSEKTRENSIGINDEKTQRSKRLKELSIHFKKTKAIGLHKYLSKFSPLENDLLRDVEFSSGFNAIDPIMDIKSTFDGYINTGTSEIFVIAIHDNNPSSNFNYYLYMMLSRINFYKKAKKADCKLVLVVVSSSDFNESLYSIGRVTFTLERFQPAIRNGLLEIKKINITNEDIVDYENYKKTIDEIKNEQD